MSHQDSHEPVPSGDKEAVWRGLKPLELADLKSPCEQELLRRLRHVEKTRKMLAGNVDVIFVVPHDAAAKIFYVECKTRIGASSRVARHDAGKASEVFAPRIARLDVSGWRSNQGRAAVVLGERIASIAASRPLAAAHTPVGLARKPVPGRPAPLQAPSQPWFDNAFGSATGQVPTGITGPTGLSYFQIKTGRPLDPPPGPLFEDHGLPAKPTSVVLPEALLPPIEFCIRLRLTSDLRAGLSRFAEYLCVTLRIALTLRRAARFRRLTVRNFTLILLAASRRYGRRDDGDDHALPAFPPKSVVRGELVLAL
jgi:hypothetical protein